MPTTFTPTELRGAPLARHILDIIEEEERRHAAAAERAKTAHVNRWRQNSWARIFMNELPPGVEIELVDRSKFARSEITRGEISLDHDQELVAFSNGLKCGTGMCFAGHVTHALGDRMVISVNAPMVNVLKDTKDRKGNFRRLITKARRRFRRFDASFTSEKVIDHVLSADTGRVVLISHRAKQALQLSDAEACAFFAADNQLHHLQTYVRRMEEGRNIVTGRKTQAAKRRLLGV